MMLLGLAPQRAQDGDVGRALSVTVITRVETKLNAATATMRVRMMNIMRFSSCTAANQVRFWLRPVADEQHGRSGNWPASELGHLARLVQVA